MNLNSKYRNYWLNIFKFCPRCKTNFIKKSPNCLFCAKCKANFYHNPIPAVCAILTNSSGEIFLGKRTCDPKREMWDLPGGFFEPFEDLNSAIKREINEEMGIKVEIENIVNILTDSYLFERVQWPTLNIFVTCRYLGGKINLSSEFSEGGYFSRDEIKEKKLAFPSVKRTLEKFNKIYEN